MTQTETQKTPTRIDDSRLHDPVYRLADSAGRLHEGLDPHELWQRVAEINWLLLRVSTRPGPTA